MTDIKNAYKVLGVKDDASREEIEKKYNILIKNYRAKKISGEFSEEDERHLTEITEAYRLLTEHQSNKEIEPEDVSPLRMKINQLIRKAGMDDKKVSNFFHYHKYHILIGLIVLIVVATSLKSCITRVDPDVNLVFLGDFYIQDTSAINSKIKSSLPGIKEVGIDIITISKNPADPQFDYTMRTKAMAVLAAGDTDLLILDKDQFKLYGEQGTFESLDGLIDELGIDREKNKEFLLKNSETNEEHLYGVDISQSSLLKEINIIGAEDRIAAIRFRAKHRDKALALLKELLK